MPLASDSDVKHVWTPNTAMDRLDRCQRILEVLEGPFGFGAPMLYACLHVNATEEHARALNWLEELVVEEFPRLMVGLPLMDQRSGAIGAHNMRSLAVACFLRSYVNDLPFSEDVARAAFLAVPALAALVNSPDPA